MTIALSMLLAASLGAGNAPALYAEAARLESRGDSARAAGKYREAIAENPFYATAWVGLGVLQLSRDNLVEATNCLRRALGIDPEEIEAAAALGRAELRLGNTERAKAVFEALAEVHPGSPEGPFGMAVLRAAAGDLDDAAALAREALKLSPRNFRVTLFLADLQQRLGESDEARRTLRRAVDINPQSAWGPYHLALYHYREGDNRRAEREVARALSVARDLVSALLLKGEILVALEKWREARQTYRLLADSYRAGDRYGRDHPDYLYNMAVCAAHEGDDDSAIALFDRALVARANDEIYRYRYEEYLIARPRRHPVSSPARKSLAQARYRRGETQQARGDREFAMAEYRRSIRLYPLDTTVRLRIADFYRELGYPERRVHEFRLIVRDLDPDNTEIRDRLEFAERNLRSRFPARWGVSQYELPPPSTRVVVFPFDTGEGGRLESGLVAARILEDMLHSRGRQQVTNFRGRAPGGNDHAAVAEKMNATCYVTGTIEERGEILRLSTRLVDTRSGTTVASNRTTRKGNDCMLWALVDAADLVFRSVPWAGRLLDYDREHGLASVGKLDAAEPGMELVVYQAGTLRFDPVRGEYVGVGEKEIGRVKLRDVDERVSTFTWEKRGLWLRLSPGQVLIPADEEKKE